jgi:hypothetical protein
MGYTSPWTLKKGNKVSINLLKVVKEKQVLNQVKYIKEEEGKILITKQDIKER